MSRRLGAIFLVGILSVCITCEWAYDVRFSPPKIGGAGREASLRWYEKSQVSQAYSHPSDGGCATSVSPRAGEKIYASTATTTTQKLQDLALGKVVQSGSLQFVKVADNQYVAKNICPEGSTYSSFYKGCVVKTTTFAYTGGEQTFTAPADGVYVVELWGAEGGFNSGVAAQLHGKGGYVSGLTSFVSQSRIFVYVGQKGGITNNSGAWNGGGYRGTEEQDGSGGGATDIRTVSGNWDDAASLRSRVIVSGAGGGSDDTSSAPCQGHAGGLSSYACTYQTDVLHTPATQTEGGTSTGPYSLPGAFGRGNLLGRYSYNGGGSGWYGGAASDTGSIGGSSYISGHTGCVAVTSKSDSTPKAGCTTGTTDNSCSISPYGYTFANTVMIDGAGYGWTNVKGALTPMPDPTNVGAYYASGVGHQGNGAARITQLSVYLGI